MTLLMIEDETETPPYLKKGLGQSAFVVDVSTNGDDGVHPSRG